MIVTDREWHSLTAEDALDELQVDLQGLSEDEANARLDHFGPNQLPEARMLGPLHVFARQFRSPLIYLLLAAGLLSLVIGDRWDATFIFGVLLLNAAVGAFQELKADASARALRSLVPQLARVRRGGVTRDIASEDMVPGDVVELESGMSVTADLRILDAVGLEVDESTFTGESMPVAKRAHDQLLDDTLVADRTNMLHAGTSIVEGRAVAVVTQTGSASQLGHIDQTLAQAARSAGAIPLVRRMAILARQIALIALGLIVVLGALLTLEGEPWREIVLLAIALAVAAIPEGLPIAVTVALSAAASRMARRNVIVRALPAVEGLGSCTLIASDKTGTLTVNRLTVEQVALPDGTTIGRSAWQSSDADHQLERLAQAAGLCNEARLRVHGSPVGDAVDVALLDFARENGCDIERLIAADRLSIVPYEPTLRYAAVEADLGSEVRSVVKGAPETVLAMCRDTDERCMQVAECLAREGYRVLALAEGRAKRGEGHIHDHLNGLTLLGFVGLTDPLRQGVVDAVAKCKQSGISVVMITGDHPATALAIGQKLGMDAHEADVVTGEQLQQLSDDSEAFSRRVSSSQIFARTEPAQKLAIVQALEKAGHIVAVTGDGVNDGPALRMADVGIAMGRSGTDVARGAADLVLADDNFATIVAGIEEGRVTFANIRKIVLFMLATGAAEILMFLLAISVGLPMPLTPVQLLWLNLVTNGVLDVTLGFGRGDGDELEHPPSRKLVSLVDRDALILMLPGAVLMTIIAVWVLQNSLALGLPIEEARNHVLLMVVTFQISFLLSIRNLKVPFWRWHAPENGWMFLGMAIAIALQLGAMTLPLMQRFLDTGPVEPNFLLQCAGAALAVLFATEIAKRWLARQQRTAEKSALETGK